MQHFRHISFVPLFSRLEEPDKSLTIRPLRLRSRPGMPVLDTYPKAIRRLLVLALNPFVSIKPQETHHISSEKRPIPELRKARQAFRFTSRRIFSYLSLSLFLLVWVYFLCYCPV